MATIIVSGIWAGERGRCRAPIRGALGGERLQLEVLAQLAPIAVGDSCGEHHDRVDERPDGDAEQENPADDEQDRQDPGDGEP